MIVLLRWDKESVNRNLLDNIFPNQKARKAAEQLINHMSKNKGTLTSSQMKTFALSLDQGLGPVRYSYKNFYRYVLGKLIALGLMEKDVPLWSESTKRTVLGYRLVQLKIPKRSPGGEYNFWKAAWLMARSWNRVLQEHNA
ncbi:MAG: hypothetical protein QXV84_06055 [Conexivisphaerales archaeon]